MADYADFEKFVEENDVKYVDFRFTSPSGVWEHMTYDISAVDAELLEEGVMFDGSSIVGWKAINDSDMILAPDLATIVMDPFFAQPTASIICDVLEPSTLEAYERDPRGIAKRAELYMKFLDVADTVSVGAEAEFFVFSDVRYSSDPYSTFFRVDEPELPINSARPVEGGNSGHHIPIKGGYVPLPPQDASQDLRGEMLEALSEMGLIVEKHHHEVASGQHELGVRFQSLLTMADQMQIYKYGVKMVAHTYGKTATFMPKPIAGDNGSGMHTHFSLWRDGKPAFAGNRYAELSEQALFFIGGVNKHARALNAFTNPSTNSYKRLVPGFEAPVLLAYSSRNRSAGCRIPYTNNPKAKRLEFRFPDALANPYLAFASILMAGLDGISSRIHPGEAMDKNLYDLPPEELDDVPTVATSLREALDALDADRSFLCQGSVFSDDFISSYIEQKMTEVELLEQNPHPLEYELYYSS